MTEGQRRTSGRAIKRAQIERTTRLERRWGGAARWGVGGRVSRDVEEPARALVRAAPLRPPSARRGAGRPARGGALRAPGGVPALPLPEACVPRGTGSAAPAAVH